MLPDASVSHRREENAIRAYIILKRVERTKIILHNVKLCLYSVCLRKVVLKLPREVTCDLYKESAMNKNLKWSYSVINLSL